MTDDPVRYFLMGAAALAVLVGTFFLGRISVVPPPECGTVTARMDSSGRMTDLDLHGVVLSIPDVPIPAKGVGIWPLDAGEMK